MYSSPDWSDWLARPKYVTSGLSRDVRDAFGRRYDIILVGEAAIVIRIFSLRDLPFLKGHDCAWYTVLKNTWLYVWWWYSSVVTGCVRVSFAMGRGLSIFLRHNAFCHGSWFKSCYMSQVFFAKSRGLSIFIGHNAFWRRPWYEICLYVAIRFGLKLFYWAFGRHSELHHRS